MALINTLRNKMGKVIVGMVAFAILSFILADLLGPNSFFFGQQDNKVGEIAGDKITLEAYQQQVDVFANNYAANFGRNPTEREMVTLRNQAWEIMIVDKAFKKEYDALGLEVGDEEIVDLVQGKNISTEITSAPIFANQQTGLFDRERLAAFLANFGSQPAQLQQQWYAFESNLKPARQRIKYENLLNKSTYVTQSEAKKLYDEQVSSADIKYLYVPFSSVNDSIIDVSESELENYLRSHKEDYKVEASKSIKLVSFKVVPSAEDTAFFKDDIEDVKREFVDIKDDSVYARINSDGTNTFGTFAPKILQSELLEIIDELELGKVYGPYLEGSSFKIYKVVEIIQDTVFSARASHILFKWSEDTPEAKAEAKSEATRVLRDIRGGADFADMARQYGTDGTANTGGDLGWFPSNEMVKPFSDAVFAATKTGLLNVVETEFGYHIIEVTHLKTNNNYKIATIERTIIASDETQDKAFRKADYFAGTNTNLNEFESSAEADSLFVIEATNIGAEQSNIAGIGDARQIVRWLFTDANKNEVSEVFEIDDTYIIVVMTDEVKEGTAKIEDVNFQIQRIVLNEKKAEYIISKLSGLSGTVDEISAAYGEGANVYTNLGLKRNSNSIPNVGAAPEAVGKIFTLEAGQSTGPVKSRSGVVLATIEAITPAPEIADFSAYKNQLLSSVEGRTSYYITESIKEGANIKDERYKFY